MAIGDKLKDFLNQKIQDFTGYAQRANSNPQEPLKVAENFSVGAANRAVDMYQNTFNNLANIGSKISGIQTGQADFSPIKKTLFPKGSRMFESDRLYEGIGGAATDITANVLGGKMLSQSPVTNPLINKAQKIGGMKAGKLIGQGKILQGRGIANVAQGLPYTVAGAVQTGLEGGSPLNIAANLAGDFVGGATFFPPMVRGANTVDYAVDLGKKVAKIKPNAWVRINKGGGYSREMPVRNIIKYLRGEMTGGRLNDPDVVELKEFVKKHPEYYYASLKADEGGFASLGAFTGKDADKIPGELLNNDIAGQMFMELDNAYAGARNATENGTVGIKSGFPQWVPSNLRDKKIFEKVYKHMVDDSVPPLKNKKEWELYGVIHSRLRRLNGIVDEPITSPKGVEVPQKMQATNTSLPGQQAYPNASMTSPQGAKPMQAVQSVGPKVEVPYTNNISPDVKFLKAGRTQLPDGTYVGPKPPVTKLKAKQKVAIDRPQFIDNARQPITQSEQRIIDMSQQQPMLPSGRRTLPDGSPVYDPRQAPRPRRPVSEQGQFQQQAPDMAYSMFRQNEDRIGTGFQDFNSKTATQRLQQTQINQMPTSPAQGVGDISSQSTRKAGLGTSPQATPLQESLIGNKESFSSETNIAQMSSDPVQKIVNALGGAKSLRNKQDLIYSAERAKRAGAINEIGANVPGEAGYKAQLGALKGALPKVEFETLRKELKQPDIDELFKRVESNPKLLPFEKITAKSGLAKLLGEEGGYLPTPGEIKLLEGVFGPEFTQAVLSKRTTMQRFFANTKDALNINRALMATFDMSAPLRQGVFLIGRPKQWLPAFKDMFKYFGSEKSYQGLIDDIQARPTYPAMKQAKLALTDIGASLNDREETFMSTLAERIPGIGKGVKASNRAYSGFLNKLRADVFDDIYKHAQNSGVLSERPGIADDIATFVNSATGRGKFTGALKPLNQATEALNSVLFSPKLLASRLNLLDPVYYMKLDPVVRKEALKSLLSFAGTGISVLALAELAGAEVGTDPRSADFGKIKIGNTRVDTWGGFQQYFRLAGQLITGEKINSQTGKLTTLGDGITAPDRYDLLLSFLESKQAPIFTFARDMLKGKDGAGNKIDPSVEMVSRFIPMVIQDAYELHKDGGSPFLALPAIFGAGIQTYGKQIPYTSQTASGKPTIKYKGIPGLPEDLVNSVRGTPASDIPQDQWGPLLEANDKKTKEDVTKQQMKEQIKNGGKGNVKFQTSSKGVQYTKQDDKLFYVDSDSSIQEIDLKLKLDTPKLTGDVTMNKALISSFKNSLTPQVNRVIKLYELGILDEKQAGSLINKIENVRKGLPKTTSSSGGGKVSIRNVTPAKVTSLKAKRTAPIKLKAIGLSKAKSTGTVKLSGRQKRAVPKVSDAQLNALRKPKLS